MGRDEEEEEGPRLWRVHTALLVALVLSGSNYAVSREALAHGMSPVVLTVYGDALAVLILFPVALVFERPNSLRLSRRVVVQLFLLGLIGIFGSQILLFIGVEWTAQLAWLLQPSVPVFTALIAILFGVEKLNLRRRGGRAKLVGVTLCCAGALLMTFYKGPPVSGWLGAALGPDTLHTKLNSAIDIGDWKLEVGAASLVGSCVCVATFINLQAVLLKEYPAPISVVAYSYLFGAMIMGAASYFLARDRSAWLVGWNVDLIAVLYNGILSSALSFGLISWALSKVGPLFVASYTPLQPVSSTVLALILWKSTVYLGSVLGTILVILGLVLVSWAHKETMRLATLSRIVQRSSRLPRVAAEARDPEPTTPLLQEVHSQV